MIILLNKLKECCQIYAPMRSNQMMAKVGEFGRDAGWEGVQGGCQEEPRVCPQGGAHLSFSVPIHQQSVLKSLQDN